MAKKINNCLAFALAIAASSPFMAQACWEEAANRFGVGSPAILYAIAKTESNLNPRAINRNSDGSYDIGLMQINSRHLQWLAKYGITEQSLFDPCTNIFVGAAILGDNMKRLGYSWEAIGAYNAGSASKREQLRLRYSGKVYHNLQKLLNNNAR